MRYTWFSLFTRESRQNIFQFSLNESLLPWMKFNTFWIALNIQVILLTTICATGSLAKTENSVFSKKKKKEEEKKQSLLGRIHVETNYVQ